MRQNRAENVADPGGAAFAKDRSKEKQEPKRHDEAEKQEHLIAHGQPQANLGQRPRISHSRSSLLAQPSAGEFDKHIFEGRRKHFQTLQFVVFRFELLHERDNGLRGTA